MKIITEDATVVNPIIDHHVQGEWFILPDNAIEEFCAQSEMTVSNV